MLPGDLKEPTKMPKLEMRIGKYTQVGTEFDYDKVREDAMGVVKGFKPGP